MKTASVLIALYITMGLIAGCAFPVGDDYVIPRNEGPGTTYITDYNLQNYVPIPNTGKPPVHAIFNREDVEVKVLWKNAGGTEVPPPFKTFLGNTVYQAEITVTAKNGYRFYPAIAFAYSDGKVTFQQDHPENSTRHITVTYNNSDDADIIFVTNYDLQRYAPIPLAGEKPIRRLTGQEDLTLEAAWKMEQPAASGTFVSIPDDEAYTFDIGTVYQAAIQLKTKPGYRFIQAANFEYTAETKTIQYGTSIPKERELTVTYAATKHAKRVDDRDLTPYVFNPMIGFMPVKKFRGTQYTGTVLWKNAETGAVWEGPFQVCIPYIAEVTLSPTTGYSLTRVEADFFTHTNAAAINNPVNNDIVTIRFSPLGLISFGPVTTDGSALKLLKEKKDESSLTVELPGGTEVVKGNSVTLAAANSPAQVVIDGHGRVLTIEGNDRGKFLTVGKGVTLTLQNISLRGANKNNSPLVEVESGGTLILGTGAVLKENRSSGDAGGVWVNGGKLIMNAGAEIKNMTAQQGGGVLISAGEFIMYDGIIQANHVMPDRKTFSNIGGGVLNTGGTFIMYNGSISGNFANNGINPSPNISIGIGGGVFNGGKGIFTMNNGVIEGNRGDSSANFNVDIIIGGGVCNSNAAFTMNNGFIRGNTAAENGFAEGGNAGGGVFNGQLGIFNMNGGTIGGEGKAANQAQVYGYRSHGVFNANVFTMSGGIITGHTDDPATDPRSMNNGVFNSGTFIMTGPATVAQNNRVDLFTGKCITIAGNLTASTPVANIKYLDDILPGNTIQTLLSANTPDLVTENYTKFFYDGKPGLISAEGKYIHTQSSGVKDENR
jgi:hypothetical protein